MVKQPQWQVQPVSDLPGWFVETVRQFTAELPGHYVAQLLWQRQIRESAQLAGFLRSELYQPTSPLAFGQEMHWALERLDQARQNAEKVAIWGDFDADGITATAVLWEGLGQFFATDRLTYYIPNRLTESHGFSYRGIEELAAQGYHLIVTCDTGSTNLEQIIYAQRLGIDVIVTDHHTLPTERPPVVAILNPRSLPDDHPLAKLSGVAVAYKLVEAFYDYLPDVPQRPLTALLDLVAIGLIADLVELSGDCRYLAQRGIEQLQQNQTQSPPPRPGIARLLELCKRAGDRPTDISFGLGPRINAISRIQGDARFCVEMLTSQDSERCRKLAEETEFANSRRKSLQREVVQQVRDQLAQLDLSTTRVIVLADSQWSVGILGLVAGQIAQEYDRPTILLTTESVEQEERQSREVGEWKKSDTRYSAADAQTPIARGSARSINRIDLYQLVQEQAHLLYSFGGHPLAAGLSLPVENIPLFTEAINRRLRQQQAEGGFVDGAILQADLVVTVAELGKDLFRELKLIEPCGMGNPVPRLLLRNCWFTRASNRNIQDWKGGKVRYIKTEFEIWDDSTAIGFPGVWWDHYRDELPRSFCDAIVELDFNSYKKRYEIRLIDVRPSGQDTTAPANHPVNWILDWRAGNIEGTDQQDESAPGSLCLQPSTSASLTADVLPILQCPGSWDEMQFWFRRATQTQQKLALAYSPPPPDPPIALWQQLVGIAKYLSRTGKTVTRTQLCERLGIGDRPLQVGFSTLKLLGFEVTTSESGFSVIWQNSELLSVADPQLDPQFTEAIAQFTAVVQEERFRRRYFYEVPLNTILAIAAQTRR